MPDRSVQRGPSRLVVLPSTRFEPQVVDHGVHQLALAQRPRVSKAHPARLVPPVVGDPNLGGRLGAKRRWKRRRTAASPPPRPPARRQAAARKSGASSSRRGDRHPRPIEARRERQGGISDPQTVALLTCQALAVVGLGGARHRGRRQRRRRGVASAPTRRRHREGDGGDACR
jgi:hypothetical protein